MWVLTGDKQETAINVGYSSHLIDDSMDVIAINAYDMVCTQVASYLFSIGFLIGTCIGRHTLVLVHSGRFLLLGLDPLMKIFSCTSVYCCASIAQLT